MVLSTLVGFNDWLTWGLHMPCPGPHVSPCPSDAGAGPVSRSPQPWPCGPSHPYFLGWHPVRGLPPVPTPGSSWTEWWGGSGWRDLAWPSQGCPGRCCALASTEQSYQAQSHMDGLSSLHQVVGEDFGACDRRWSWLRSCITRQFLDNERCEVEVLNTTSCFVSMLQEMLYLQERNTVNA